MTLVSNKYLPFIDSHLFTVFLDGAFYSCNVFGCDTPCKDEQAFPRYSTGQTSLASFP